MRSEQRPFHLTDALIIAAVPVLAFVIVALFRLGQDHYYGAPSLWTTGDAAEVFNVAKDLATIVGTSFLTNESIIIVITFFLFLMGLVLVIRHDMQDFDDMTVMGCMTVFVASFKVTPIICLVILYVFITQKQFIRSLIAGGRDVDVERFNHPALRWIAGACLILSPFYYLGYMSAYHQGSAYVNSDGPQYIMLQKYGDYVMTEPATMTQIGNAQTLNVTSGVKWFKLGEKDTPIFYLKHFSESTVDGWRAPWVMIWLVIP